MNYLYNEYPRDIEKWNKKIKSNVKKIKVNKFDENETEFIDIDLVMSYYIEEYKYLRRQIIFKCSDIYNEKQRLNNIKKIDFNVKDIRNIMRRMTP